MSYVFTRSPPGSLVDGRPCSPVARDGSTPTTASRWSRLGAGAQGDRAAGRDRRRDRRCRHARAVLFQWLPTSASEEFDRIQDIYWFATVMSIVIFSLVAAVVVFSVWKWRVPPDDDAEGPPIHGHTGLEIAWTAVPAILVIALGIVSAFVISENGKASDERAAGARRSASSSPGSSSIRIRRRPSPASSSSRSSRQAQFTMEAVDVLHSFWVPKFGQKMDAVPGIETHDPRHADPHR